MQSYRDQKNEILEDEKDKIKEKLKDMTGMYFTF